MLAADLVVDASGPRGKTRQWLEEGGYPVQDVRTVEVDPHVGYTMEVLDVPDEVRGTPLPHASVFQCSGRVLRIAPACCRRASIRSNPPLRQVAKDIKWKFNYVRPQAPDTKGFLAIHVERGRFQVSVPLPSSSQHHVEGR